MTRAADRFGQHGVEANDAPALARTVIMLLEGAFLLCRAGRTTVPMTEAAVVAVGEVRRAVGRS